MNKKLLGFVSAAAVGLASLAPINAHAIPVALELILLVDVSGSVDATEYNLQKQGYVNAFNDPTIQANIASLAGLGGIAVTYVEWSSAGTAVQLAGGWTQLTDATTAGAFATAINGVSRSSSGLTAPGSAINFAVPLFTNNFEGTRRVIDVSGDGSQNDGANTATARDNAVAAGITINGLPILGSEAGLQAWYQNNIVGGGGFLVAASDFGDFNDAIKTKIGREITQTPEPGSLALLGLGLLGLGAGRRRKTA